MTHQLRYVNNVIVAKIMVLLICFSLLTSTKGSAQIVTPQVTDAFGIQFSQNGIYIDMSCGEFAVSTLKSSSHIITQGFLQPISIEQPCESPTLLYYPNPVTDKLTLAATDCDVIVDYIEAYDLFGKSVLTTSTVENVVDLRSIGVGVYILRAYTENGRLLGTVKIIKTTV